MKKNILFLLCFGLLFPRIAMAQPVSTFEGQINFSQKKSFMNFSLGDRGMISAQFKEASKNNFHITLNIDHLQMPLFTLTTILEGSLSLKMDKESQKPSILGEVKSRYSLINNKPVREFSGLFEIKDQRLNLSSLSFGNLQCRGFIDLIAPYKTNIVFKLTDVKMKDFLAFWAPNKDIESSGLVSGDIQLSGSLTNAVIKGQLSSYEGFVDELFYNNILVSFEGIYPVIYLRNSSVSRVDGLDFSLEGALNLGDKENFDKQIAALTKSSLVTEGGSELEWTFKRVQRDKESGKTELKYLFRKNNASGSQEEKASDMFGVERSIEF